MFDREFMELCAREFRESNAEGVKIVYGTDNLLWRRYEKICRKVGVQPMELTATYHAHANPYLTQQQMSQVAHLRADPKIFEQIKFDAGVEDILRPQELCPRVQVHILDESYKPEIFAAKMAQLMRTVDGLEQGQIHSHILTKTDNVEQTAPEDTTILVSANPHTVQESNAPINIMPNWLGWTRSNDMIRTGEIRGRNVVWKSSLKEITDFVYELTKLLLQVTWGD